MEGTLPDQPIQGEYVACPSSRNQLWMLQRLISDLILQWSMGFVEIVLYCGRAR